MAQLASAPSRFVVLDSLRGICAVLVCMHHLAATAHIYFAPLIRNAFLFVDFFFVLSGFVITHAYIDRLESPKDVAVFSLRRLGRVWPLHVAVLAAFMLAELLNLVLAAAFNFRTGHPPFDPDGYRPLAAIPIHLLLLQAAHVTDRLTWNIPSWSISAEFWTYIIFGAICLLRPSRRSVALTAAAVLALASLAAFSPHGINVHYDFGIPRALYGFAIGHLFLRAYRAFGARRLPFATAWELSAAAVVLILVWNVGESWASLLLPLVFGSAVFIFCLESGKVSSFLARRPLQLLGLWSYSIYMVHIFVAMLVMLAVTVLQKALRIPLLAEYINPETNQTYRVITNLNPYILDLVFLVYVSLTIALAGITFRFVEVPGRRFFNHLSDVLQTRWSQPDARNTVVDRSSSVSAAPRAATEG